MPEIEREKKTDSSGQIFIFQAHDAYKGNSMLDTHYKVFSFIWHKHKSALWQYCLSKSPHQLQSIVYCKTK